MDHAVADEPVMPLRVGRLEGEPDAARLAWNEALALYKRISEPYSIGSVHLRLARAGAGSERAAHLAAARAAWESIDRPDLVAKYLDTFG